MCWPVICFLWLSNGMEHRTSVCCYGDEGGVWHMRGGMLPCHMCTVSSREGDVSRGKSPSGQHTGEEGQKKSQREADGRGQVGPFAYCSESLENSPALGGLLLCRRKGN